MALSSFLARIGASITDIQQAEAGLLRLYYDCEPFLGQQCRTTNIEGGNVGGPPAIIVSLSETFKGAFPKDVRFLFRFFNTPEGVRIAVPDAIGVEAENSPAVLHLVEGTNANGDGGHTVTPGGRLREILLSGGFGVAVYEMVSRRSPDQMTINVPLHTGWTADTANDLPGVGSMQFSVGLAPVTTLANPPIGSFWDTNPDLVSGIVISRCTTSLLFPFVTNQSGFDTGIVISNTSQDILGTPTTRGACSIYFYGGTEASGAGSPFCDGPGPQG